MNGAGTAVAAVTAGLAVVIVAVARRPLVRRPLTAGDAPPHHVAGTPSTVRRHHRSWWARFAPGAGSPRERAVVADWCDDLGGRLRSGSTLRDALASTVPTDAAVDQATEPMRHALARGSSTDDALGTITGATSDLELAIHALTIAARVGGSPAPAIDRTAAVLRQRTADRAERAAQSAQARMSAHVLTLLPLGVLTLLALIDPDVRTIAAQPVGAACVVTGLTLNAIGWYWMRRVVRGAP